MIPTIFDIEYDRTLHFTLFSANNGILSNQSLKVAILRRVKLVEKMEDKDWQMMDDRVLLIIQLCFSESTMPKILIKSTTTSTH